MDPRKQGTGTFAADKLQGVVPRTTRIAQRLRELSSKTPAAVSRREYDRWLITEAIQLGLVRYDDQAGVAVARVPDLSESTPLDDDWAASADAAEVLYAQLDDIEYALEHAEAQQFRFDFDYERGLVPVHFVAVARDWFRGQSEAEIDASLLAIRQYAGHMVSSRCRG